MYTSNVFDLAALVAVMPFSHLHFLGRALVHTDPIAALLLGAGTATFVFATSWTKRDRSAFALLTKYALTIATGACAVWGSP